MGRIIKEPAYILDSIETVHFNSHGEVISRRKLNNGLVHRFLKRLHLVHDSMTDDGLAAVAALIGNVSGAPAAFQSIGIGIAPAGGSETQLETALVLKTATTITRITIDNPDDTLELIYTFSSADGLTGTSVAIVEVGVFNGNINGTSIMLLHQVYSPPDTMNWDQGDYLRITVKVQSKQG